MMLRWLLVGFNTAFLSVAFLQAPFAHDHPDDPGHNHASGFVHTHLVVEDHHLVVEDHHHLDEGPEIEPHHDEEPTIYREWAPSVAPRIEVVYAEVAVWIAHCPTFISTGIAPAICPRAHSPPSERLLPPRSPPV